jgi:glutamine synthetase
MADVTQTHGAAVDGRVFGGTVATVLGSPRIAPPPATLEEARNVPGRGDRIAELAQRIETEGIKYVFFQQVSITGRVMGKGVVASFFPQVAEKGYQLVYGATANLFTDRAGNYIGFGPEESELAAMADLDTFAVLPWDSRVARVYCDCYDTESGELLDADHARTSSASRTSSRRSSATSSSSGSSRR